MEIFNQIDDQFFKNVQIVGTPEDPEFVLSDICKSLQITSVHAVRRGLPEDWFSTTTISSRLMTKTFITANEAALYNIVLNCKNDIAHKIQDYILETILPKIFRKDNTLEFIDEIDSFIKGKIQLINEDENTLFVFNDVCKVLKLSNSTQSIQQVPEKWKKSSIIKKENSNKLIWTLTEPGFYRSLMLFRKNIPTIQKEFQKHVFEDLLPAYRKNISIPFAILIAQPTVVVVEHFILPVVSEPVDVESVVIEPIAVETVVEPTIIVEPVVKNKKVISNKKTVKKIIKKKVVNIPEEVEDKPEIIFCENNHIPEEVEDRPEIIFCENNNIPEEDKPEIVFDEEKNCNILNETFNFNNNEVRIIGTYEEPWFVAKDICDILELSQVNKAILNIPEKWKGRKIIPTLGGEQEMVIINEPALYKMIMRSNKENAQPFQDYVCEEVLPSIRKRGSYILENKYKFILHP